MCSTTVQGNTSNTILLPTTSPISIYYLRSFLNVSFELPNTCHLLLDSKGAWTDRKGQESRKKMTRKKLGFWSPWKCLFFLCGNFNSLNPIKPKDVSYMGGVQKSIQRLNPCHFPIQTSCFSHDWRCYPSTFSLGHLLLSNNSCHVREFSWREIKPSGFRHLPTFSVTFVNLYGGRYWMGC